MIEMNQRTDEVTMEDRYAPEFSPRHHENADRCRGDDWPCFICGKPCKPTAKNRWFMTLNGYYLIPDEREGNSGAYPVGPECLRKLPSRVKAWGKP